ncbi:MAG: prolyl oligopeptidase family serine peptidase [Bacteroidales bacterium]|nr:prolyl oligopeptidase family serine peptidase [Bacteroidales bacterium]
MKFLRITLVFVFAVLTSAIAAQQINRFNKEVYTDNQGNTLLYRILSPDYNLSRKYPLVIFLHGSGERGNDNTAQLKWGVMQFATDKAMSEHPAIVVAPQCPKGQTWADLQPDQNGEMDLAEHPTKPMKLVLELIHQLIKTMPVDTTRIYITGLSMGGFGTYDAIEREPGLFAAAVPVCGAGDSSKATEIAKIPIWIFHGADDPVVPVQFSYDMAQALIKAGAHPGLTIYPGVGHFSWVPAYSDPLMMNWLFDQQKK